MGDKSNLQILNLLYLIGVAIRDESPCANLTLFMAKFGLKIIAV